MDCVMLSIKPKWCEFIASATGHIDQAARNEYYQNAKKYYFSLMMGSGGQTGIKKQLKESEQHM